MAIAIRRNLGNVGAQDFGALVLMNVSGQTVARYEVDAGTCLTASFKSFHREHELELLSSPPDQNDFNIVAHSFRSDATTSGVHLGQKLHNTELMSTYVHDVIGSAMSAGLPGMPRAKGLSTNALMICLPVDLSTVLTGFGGSNSKAFEGHCHNPITAGNNTFPDLRKMFCETQRVHDASALGTCALLWKQLRQCGCPVPGPELSRSAPHTIRMYLYTSDGGSDQIKFKRIASRMLFDHPSVFFVAASCQFHIYQLVVKSSLVSVDQWAIIAITHIGVACSLLRSTRV
jgi:hypothetical protein